MITTRIKALQKHYATIIKPLDKQLVGQDTRNLYLQMLHKPHIITAIKKIVDNLRYIQKNVGDIPSSFAEFSEHIIDDHQQITSISKNQDPNRKQVFFGNKKSKSYHFRVHQYGKSKLDTYLLGDQVGCCLATTNSQFDSMIFRQVDDACLFHVATDMKTGKAAALIWLYLAETHEGKISLIANFFEVNTHYALSDNLRLALLKGLLSFTQQYCQDNPNIDGFYMPDLVYGHNIRDLDCFDIIPENAIQLDDKAGGPFSLRLANNKHDTESYETDRYKTIDKYHFPSLKKPTTFRRFDSSAFANKFPKTEGIKTKHETIQETIAEYCKQKDVITQTESDKPTPTELFEFVAKKYFELSPYYKEPMLSDESFKKDVAHAYQEHVHSNEISTPKTLPLIYNK